MELPGSNVLSKESFSYILGNGDPQKIPYYSGKGTCFFLFQKTETLKNFLYFRR